MIPEPGDIGLCERLPCFRRARDWRLYDQAGKRYVDCWQLDGHAILGHRAAGMTTAMKAAISKGLVGELPSVSAARLVRALRRLLPTHPFVRVYSSLDRCLDALGFLCGRPVRAADIVDPASASEPGLGRGEPVVWRPFVPSGGYAAARALVPVLPFGACGGPWALCLAEEPPRGLPPSEPVSAMVLDAVTRGLVALARHNPEPPAALLSAVRSAGWSVVGPYVLPSFPSERYPEVFEAFLGAGLVLSPRLHAPSILPPVMSEGEVAMAVGLFRAFPAQ